ncbi:MAG: hypothetical protein P1V36_09530 [Planctomycetota bacterium]|nr:hypothetical protein [Planctomycetota bacterium]
MDIIYQLAGLAGLVCVIILIVKMFQTSVLQGVLGIVFFCIWPLIWGLMNQSKPGVKKPALILAACWVIQIALTATGTVQMPEFGSTGAGG